MEKWRRDLETWLVPFVKGLRHKTRARMCPAYIAGLIGPGDRKSVQPMAERFAPGDYDQLHHFFASGAWETGPLEAALLAEADKMVGGEDAWLIVDDTALPKKGDHSVGVAPQYASSLGKTANCQSLVSVTLASREVPVMVGLRAVPARDLDGGSRAHGPGPSAEGSPDFPDQARDRHRGDRSCDGCRPAFRLRAGRCGIRLERAFSARP